MKEQGKIIEIYPDGMVLVEIYTKNNSCGSSCSTCKECNIENLKNRRIIAKNSFNLKKGEEVEVEISLPDFTGPLAVFFLPLCIFLMALIITMFLLKKYFNNLPHTELWSTLSGIIIMGIYYIILPPIMHRLRLNKPVSRVINKLTNF